MEVIGNEIDCRAGTEKNHGDRCALVLANSMALVDDDDDDNRSG